MGWLLLALAIAFEILGTVNMKLSEGFTRVVPSVLIFVFYGISFWLFTYAVKYMEISIAYAVWSGIGTATISIIGFFFFNESVSLAKVVAITLIIVGVVTLNLNSLGH